MFNSYKIAILVLVLIPILAQSSTIYSGKVIAITDGDTIKILSPAKEQIKVRLADIDTPEKRQPYGRKARQVLSDKVFGKRVKVEKVTADRYKRMIGKVYLGDRYINPEMVADGAAWVYRKYSKDPHMLELERQAREQAKGLWALQEDQRVASWEWREQRKNRCLREMTERQ
jgi:endonuclease YncB( thermonuclease family)